MKNSLIEVMARHYIECFKLRANTDYDFGQGDSFQEAITEDATDMLFGPSFRKDVESMTNEQYIKYLRKVQEECKTVKVFDPADSATDTPESKEDSFLGNATNS